MAEQAPKQSPEFEAPKTGHSYFYLFIPSSCAFGYSRLAILICKKHKPMPKLKHARVDYRKQVLIVGTMSFPLVEFEEFILKYWAPLATANANRIISNKGQMRFTYDWNKIFHIAIEGGFILMEFLENKELIQK